MAVILIRSVVFFLVLNTSMRLMGKRQIGEIQLTEFVSAVLLTELAVLPVANTDIPLLYGLVGIVTLACLEVISAYLCRKAPAFRRVVEGLPLLLVAKGRVIEKNLTKSRISTDELFAAVRSAGLAGMEGVGYVVLEQTGSLSVIPAGKGRIAHAVILDGKVQKRALADSGHDLRWLEAQLDGQSLRKDALLYFTVDDDGATDYAAKSGN